VTSSSWSDQARVLVRPFRTYAELGAEDEAPRPAIYARLFVLMVVLGAFVSFTAAGRLVPLHVVSPSIAWAYVPLLQLAATALVRRRFVRQQSVARIYALYLAGHGGWMLLLLAIASVCLFAPDAPAALLWLLRTGIIPLAVLANFVWGIVITFALFRRGLGLTRGTAHAATALFYSIYAGSIASWFLVTGQLHTLFQR
jgi:hypothetical protein